MLKERSAHRSSLFNGIRLGCVVFSCTFAPFLLSSNARADQQTRQPTQQNVDSRRAARNLDRLFSDEMKNATMKLKWRGERLTEDTIYAVALTGDSWEPAWDKEQMFSLAWGDSRKILAYKKHGIREKQSLIESIRALYAARQYRRAVDAATAEFSLDEIGCDVNLKEYVGASLMALGQPEQAFPVYSAPFEQPAAQPKTAEYNRTFRVAALDAAIRAGLTKEAVCFSLSLLLEPDVANSRPDDRQIEYLQQQGVDIDRVLLGILQAPERLRGLPSYYYTASDLVAYRASPRVLPMLLQLADSSDVYLRSRALLGLGLAAYQPRADDPKQWSEQVIFSTPQEFGISSGERKLVDKELLEGASSDRYRLRSSAALAMGLIGDSDYTTVLQKLSKDRAYVLLDEGGEKSKSRRIYYPVRMAASAALDRFGIASDPGGGGVLSGRELDRAKHGGVDETNDHRNLRKEVSSTITISPVDVAMGTIVR